MSFRAWILTVVLLPSPVAAVTPYLVKDIDPSGIGEGSKPTGFASLESRAIFFTDTRELWSSDGEAAGTFRLTGETFSPSALAVGESVAYVKADDPSGFQLWATDGSADGTRQLTTDPLQFDGNARRHTLLVLPGTDRIFFTAEDANHGLELWTSDATAAGTHEVANLAAGPDGSAPHELTLFRGRVFFVADDGGGFSLWSTHGTTADTRRFEGPSGGPWFLAVVESRLYFFVQESDGWTLWKSDGSAGGTDRVKRFAPAAAGEQAVTAVSDAIGRLGRLFFVVLDGRGSRQLWVSDGTSAGTRRLTRFSGASSFAEGSFPPQPAPAATGGLLFAATDRGRGREPWTSDGTMAGTHSLLDICPGTCSGWVDSNRAAAFRGRVVFPATTRLRGTELWSTDGTAAGTRLLYDACRGACSGDPYPIGHASGKLYFGASGGFHDQVWRTNGTSSGTVRLSDFPESPAPGERYAGAGAGRFFLFDGLDALRGRELWRTDGSRPGTELVADLAANHPGSSSPQALRRAGSRVVFLANDHDPAGDGTGLWASDGTEAGTQAIVAASGPGSPFLLSGASTGDHVTYFYEIENGVYDLWRTDGTAAGTFPITPPGFRIETSQAVQVFGDFGYFTAENADLGEELWITDGTRAGTRLVADVDPGPPGSQPDRFASFVGHLVFEARVDGNLVLYSSDGTEAGTKPLVEAFPFLVGARLLDVETGGIALFQKNDASSHAEIWATDGTEAGTHLVLGGLTFLSDFAASGGRFLFRAGASFDSQAVYLSDGTSAGTHPIATDLALHSDLVRLQAIGGRFAFSASKLDDPSHPALWWTDGTPEGTQPLIETPGAFDQPRSATAFESRLLLAGGSRLWSTDGTPEGTAVVLETGTPSPAPLPVVAGARAFYPWATPEIGTELWALRAE
ncbi:MAG TPA: hypothetical protein VGS22_07475 [Thermoanaerobaculia bacterium]|jgi:ELWxxDGT repeat protein|nr:hypothetical protein [Thermoanaerobaculia bacterium]